MKQCMRASESEWLVRETVNVQPCRASVTPNVLLEGRAH